MSMDHSHARNFSAAPASGAGTAGSARPGDATDLFDAARRRLTEGRQGMQPDSVVAVEAEAITRLPLGVRPIDRYFAGRNARPATIDGYHRRIRRAQELLHAAGFRHGTGKTPAEEFPWHLVSVEDAANLRTLVNGHFDSLKSIENIFGVVREMARFCVRAGLLSTRQLDDLLEELPVRAAPFRRVGRELQRSELEELLSAAGEQSDPWVAARDTAILATFAGTGSRVCEVADFDISHLHLGAGLIQIDRTKGGEPRSAWLPEGTVASLSAWVEARGTRPGALFLASSGGRLTPGGLRKIVERTRVRAGVAQFSLHDFRRTYITTMLRNGVDPFTTMRAVGHKRVETTLIYDRRTNDDDRKAVRRLDVPWARLGANDAGRTK